MRFHHRKKKGSALIALRLKAVVQNVRIKNTFYPGYV